VKDCIEESLKKEGKSTFDPCAVVELQTWLAELFLQQKPTADETSAIDTLTKALQLLNAHNVFLLLLLLLLVLSFQIHLFVFFMSFHFCTGKWEIEW
jgi:hypothetical protein